MATSGGRRPLILLVVVSCLPFLTNAQVDVECYNEWKKCVNGEIDIEPASPYLCDLVYTVFGNCAKPLTCQDDLSSQFTELINGFQCTESLPDPCLTSQCQNGGTCQKESSTEYSCVCLDGFTGEWCGQTHGSTGGCPPGVNVVNCFDNPCSQKTCPGNPNATCKADYCGGCNYYFVDNSGQRVSCPIPTEPFCQTGISRSRCITNPCFTAKCPEDPNATCKPDYCGGCNYYFEDTKGQKVNCTKPKPTCNDRAMQCANSVTMGYTDFQFGDASTFCEISRKLVVCYNNLANVCQNDQGIDGIAKQTEEQVNMLCTGEMSECGKMYIKCNQYVIGIMRQIAEGVNPGNPQTCRLATEANKCFDSKPVGCPMILDQKFTEGKQQVLQVLTSCQNPDVRPGNCPQVMNGSAGIGIQQCNKDSDCLNQDKCCSNGFGNVCIAPTTTGINVNTCVQEISYCTQPMLNAASNPTSVDAELMCSLGRKALKCIDDVASKCGSIGNFTESLVNARQMLNQSCNTANNSTGMIACANQLQKCTSYAITATNVLTSSGQLNEYCSLMDKSFDCIDTLYSNPAYQCPKETLAALNSSKETAKQICNNSTYPFMQTTTYPPSCNGGYCQNGGTCRYSSNGEYCVCQPGYSGDWCQSSDVRPGNCPPVMNGSAGIGIQQCNKDSDCFNSTYKCCSNGFGNVCIAPTTTGINVNMCVQEISHCTQPIVNAASNPNSVDAQLMCSLGRKALKCIDDVASKCGSIGNLTESLVNARQMLNQSCNTANNSTGMVACANELQKCASYAITATNVLTSSGPLNEYCSLMDKSFDCIDTLYSNPAYQCPKETLAALNSSKETVKQICNKCYKNPCLNNGVCYETDNDFKCECSQGYYGKMCEFESSQDSPCFGTYCQHGGICQQNSYCYCMSGYTGRVCENRIVTTTSYPTMQTTYPSSSCNGGYCRNGGSCRYSSNGEYCFCQPGYSGDWCQTSDVRPGKCPPVMDGSAGIGIQQCNKDSDCLNQDKCCSNGFGNVCTAPTTTGINVHTCLQEISNCTQPIVSAVSNLTSLDVGHICSLGRKALKCIDDTAKKCGTVGNFTESLVNARQMLNQSCNDANNSTGMMSCAIELQKCAGYAISAANLLTSNGASGFNEYCSLMNKSFGCIDTLYNDPAYSCPIESMAALNSSKETVNQICNKCYKNPCLNNGVCLETTNDFKCECLQGYYGKMCEFESSQDSPCFGTHCQHGGKCQQNSYCDCTPGYTGRVCENHIETTTPYYTTVQTTTYPSSCNGGYCQNGGSCRYSSNGEYCFCKPGYSGPYCDSYMPSRPKCIDWYCENGGQCFESSYFDAYCVCAPSHYGEKCQYELENNKGVDPFGFCNGSYCQNGGRCVRPNDTKYCWCKGTFSGKYCQNYSPPSTTISPIYCSIGCNNNGNCLPTSTGGVCNCMYGYYGMYCEYRGTNTTSPVDYCNGGYCKNGGSCVGNSNEDYCSCQNGYSGRWCEIVLDADKCLDGEPIVQCLINPCQTSKCYNYPNATCRSNYCGGCNAVYFDEYNNVVDCLSEMNTTCPGGEEKVFCAVHPCMGRACPERPDAVCRSNNCGGCNYYFEDAMGQEVNCSKPEPSCLEYIRECATNATLNYQKSELSYFTKQCNISKSLLNCYENEVDVCSNDTTFIDVVNRTRTQMAAICDSSVSEDCNNMFSQCETFAMKIAYLMSAGFNYNSKQVCSQHKMAIECFDSFNVSDCPQLLNENIAMMRTGYKSICLDYASPCSGYPCGSGSCMASPGSQKGYKCSCLPGVYGDNCEVRICDYFDGNPCGPGGLCVGDVLTGNMCECPYGREGIFCEVADYEKLTMECPRRQRVAKYIIGVVNGTRPPPQKLMGSVLNLFRMVGESWLAIPDCTDKGYYSGLMTEVNLFTPASRMYYCVDEYGNMKNSSYRSYSRPNCDESEDPCYSSPCQNNGACLSFYKGTERYYTCSCSSGFQGKNCDLNLCDNMDMDPCTYFGGSCRGDLDNGVMCNCPAGRVGTLCDRAGNVNDSTKCERIHEMTVVVEQYLNKTKIIPFTDIAGMIRRATSKIGQKTMWRPYCDENGNSRGIGCEIQIADTQKQACYCLDEHDNIPQGSVPSYTGLPECIKNTTDTGCPPNVPIAMCFVEPCRFDKCPLYPNAECRNNYCGGCNSEFYHPVTGMRVNCSLPQNNTLERPGRCPPVMDGSAGIGIQQCDNDSDCFNPTDKCCSNGFGHQCMAPVTNSTTGPPTAMSLRAPTIEYQSEVIQWFKLREPVRLECRASGGNITYTWKKSGMYFNANGMDDRVSQVDGSLYFHRPVTSDFGLYQCVADNMQGTAISDVIALNEATFETNNMPFRNIVVKLGDPLTLGCNVPQSYPEPKLFWMTLNNTTGNEDEVEYDDRVVMDLEGNLHFANVKTEDFANIKYMACYGVNHVLRRTESGPMYTFFVHGTTPELHSPKLISSPPATSVALMGESFTVKCIFGGNPTPKVKFQPIGGQKMSSLAVQSGPELRFLSVQEADQGMYQCYVDTPANRKKRETSHVFNIRVQVKPYFMVAPRSQNVKEGDNAVFNCKAEGNPKPVISWYINGKPLQDLTSQERQKIDVNLDGTSLMVTYATSSNNMAVQCNASNTYGHELSNMYLFVRPANAFKHPGVCPTMMNSSFNVSIQQCNLDTDCYNSTDKCCYNGIGYQCMAPYQNTTQGCATMLGQCLNGGTCLYANGTYCLCPVRYVGQRCQTWRSLPCDKQPCQNGASCSDQYDGINYRCSCPSSWGKNCENPSHDNCTCGQFEKCVLKEYCNITNGRYYDCHVKKMCIALSVNDPCNATRCPMNSECVIDTAWGSDCRCKRGFSGANCTRNDKVCERFMNQSMCAPNEQGTCVGDLMNGVMCQCGAGIHGPFCENYFPRPVNLTKCEQKKELFDAVIDRTNYKGRMLLAIMKETRAKWLPLVKCTQDGYFEPQQCFINLMTNTTKCHCVDSRGTILSDVVSYPGYPVCTVPDSSSEIAKKICSDPRAEMCLNGGRCSGDVFNGKFCHCQPGYSGLFCQRQGNPTTSKMSICQMNKQAFALISQFTRNTTAVSNTPNQLPQIGESARYMLSIFEVLLMGPLKTYFNDSYVPNGNCTEDGDFNPVQCEYNAYNMSRRDCYCVHRNGSFRPGSRVMFPNYPDCSKNHTGQCYDDMNMCSRKCAFGYAKDVMGCSICVCKSPCDGNPCGPNSKCVEVTSSSCGSYPAPCRVAKCLSADKPGKCPSDKMANMTHIVNMFSNNLQTCASDCGEDGDCADDWKCCGGPCGSQCVKPLEKKTCTEHQDQVTSSMKLYETMVTLMKNQTALITLSITYPQMFEMMKEWMETRETQWKPRCTESGEYLREQCYIRADTQQPVYCFCVDSNGQHINGTKSMVDNSTVNLFSCSAKPGLCPKVEDGTMGIAVELCNDDYSCRGNEKCCSNGAGHVCKLPVHKDSSHESMPDLCKINSDICTALDPVGKCIGDWNNANLCQCSPGKSGLLCLQGEDGEKMTVCERKRELWNLFYRGMNDFSTEQEFYMLMATLKGEMARRKDLGIKTILMKAECQDDGLFVNSQCNVYLETNKTQECFCVNSQGHKISGTEVKHPNKPKCTDYSDPNAMCPIGKPLGDGVNYATCGWNAMWCPSGYECNLGKVYRPKGDNYSNGYCCLSPKAHENRCNVTVDKGVNQTCEEKMVYQTSRYYYDSDMQKCLPYNITSCNAHIENINTFMFKDKCERQCLENVKEGRCSDVPTVFTQNKQCADQCGSDNNCTADRKCCSTSCGKRCTVPNEDVLVKDKPCQPGVQPLADFNCGRGGQRCPANYYCDNAPNDAYAGCCPEKTDVCSLPSAVGHCRAAMPRWFYNSQKQKCEQFTYGGCGGNDNNFMTREECCNSCGKDGCKADECPPIKKGIFATCENRCDSDADCYGNQLCCSNGCGRICVAPTKNASSSCFRELEKANLQTRSLMMGQCSSIYIPRCNLDGTWKAEQCMDQYGLCWCVHDNGTHIPHTMVSGTAKCLPWKPLPGRGVPAQPSYPTLKECGGNFAKINWNPTNDNGYSILGYMVQFKISDSDKWYNYSKTFSADSTSATIQLHPYAKYQFRIVAKNIAGYSEPSFHTVKFCETQPGRPESNPTNVSSRLDEQDMLVITWKPLHRLHHGGPGLKYYIYIKETTDSFPYTHVIDDPTVNYFKFKANGDYKEFLVKIEATNQLGNAIIDAEELKLRSGEAEPAISPMNLKLDAPPGKASATLIWDAVNPDDVQIKGRFHGYQLAYWELDNDMGKITVDVEAVENTTKVKYVLMSLTPATTYRAEVRVRNTHYIGPATSLDFETALPTAKTAEPTKNSTMDESVPNTMFIMTAPACPNGESIHCCSPDLCKMAICLGKPSAVCRINPCGKCSVKFYDYFNNVVDCTKDLSKCEKQRHAALQARNQHAMNNMTDRPTAVINNNSIEARMKTADGASSMPAVNLTVCNQPPETGMCRAYFPRYYYNPANRLCEKFIYGGCGGNDNKFETLDDCYEKCSPSDHYCTNFACKPDEVCKIMDKDDNCFNGACRHGPRCVRVHPDPRLSGVHVPDCYHGKFEYKQCHHDYCWCVDKIGEPVMNSLTKGPLTCNDNGRVQDESFMPETCPNNNMPGNALPNMHCFNICQSKVCPNHPDAVCSVDLCNLYCSYKFLNSSGDEVECGSDVCKVTTAKPNVDCVAPVVCPGQSGPKICPTDICDEASCYGNPCAVCTVDPCTCKPVFTDALTNKTVSNCQLLLPACKMEYCRMMQDKNRALLMGYTIKEDITSLQCDGDGRYQAKQCDEDVCWCVNGRGELTKNLVNREDSCERNEVTEVVVELKFNQDFSKIENDIPEFQKAVLELFEKYNLKDYVKSIKVSAGSVVVEGTFADPKADKTTAPDPMINLIPDILKNKVKNNEVSLQWRGQEWKPETDYFKSASKFESQTGEEPPTTEAPTSPTLTTKRPKTKEGLDKNLIIVIAVVCSVVGVTLFGIMIWACCCRRQNKPIKDTLYNENGRDSPQPPFGVTNNIYMTNGMKGDIIPNIKPMSETEADNDIIKYKL